MDNKEVKLLDLEFNGEHLFVYSDRFNIFFFFFDREERTLYKITTDKYFVVEAIDEIKTPDGFEQFSQIKFFKPLCQNGNEYTFIGIIQFGEKAFKFKITDTNKVIYTEQIVYRQPDGIIDSLKCLKSVDISSYIQKKNKLYLVGYDREFEDYIFAIVSIEDDKLERVYSLYSDYGDVIPFSINTDVDEGKVYVVGKTLYLNKDNPNIVEHIKPFFETFLLGK